VGIIGVCQSCQQRALPKKYHHQKLELPRLLVTMEARHVLLQAVTEEGFSCSALKHSPAAGRNNALSPKKDLKKKKTANHCRRCETLPSSAEGRHRLRLRQQHRRCQSEHARHRETKSLCQLCHDHEHGGPSVEGSVKTKEDWTRAGHSIGLRCVVSERVPDRVFQGG
jgi:hypothetical protein